MISSAISTRRCVAEESRPATRFTFAGVREGFFAAQPLAPGVAVYGLVFGVLAGEAQLSWLEALLMSSFVYSGSAQIAALQVWSSSPALLPLIATILVMNARYLLFSAALQPWLSGVRPGQAYASLFFLGDGNWVLSTRHHAGGHSDAGYVLGSGVAMFLPWTLGTLAGHLLGALVSNPARLGLDFMLVAFSAAMGLAMWRGRGDWLPALAAGLVALALWRLVPGAWYIVGAGLAGAGVAALRYRPPAAEGQGGP